MAGILYGVGVGFGDPECMTLKAVRVIRDCGVIGIPVRDKSTCAAYDIALRAVPEIMDKELVSFAVPMTTDEERLNAAYAEVCKSLALYLERGNDIAFLNLGDPTVYGTYMNIHRNMLEAGYRAELISGVPSFCAVAAELQIPLGLRREAVHILPGYYAQSEARFLAQEKGRISSRGAGSFLEAELRGYLERGDSVVLMKPAGKMPELKRLIEDLEEQGLCKAYAVTNCGMAGQQVYHDIRDMEENAGYFTTVILKAADGNMSLNTNKDT